MPPTNCDTNTGVVSGFGVVPVINLRRTVVAGVSCSGPMNYASHTLLREYT